MKCITIITKDQPGVLADISYILGKVSISIKGLHVEVIGENALISILVKDVAKAKRALEGSNYTTTGSDAIVVKVADHSGGIDRISELLSQAKVTINEIRKLAAHGEEGVFSLSVDRPRKAARTLEPFILNTY